MSTGMRLEGLGEHLNKLNQEIKNKKIATKTGLIKAGLFIQRESQKECPIDTANMKNSAYTDFQENMTQNPRVAIGYSAVYALRQHEEVTWRHAVGKAKFLEDPIKRNTGKVLEILETEYKR
jgi:hypothetical protein